MQGSVWLLVLAVGLAPGLVGQEVVPEAAQSRPTSRVAAGVATLPAGYSRPKKCRKGGYLGLYITDALRKDGAATVLIESVFAGSDAERLGFRRGDEILAVDGRRLRNADQFIAQVWHQYLRRGKKLKQPRTVTVARAGKEIKLRAGLSSLDAHPAVGDPAPGFVATTSDGKAKVDLQKMLGAKPVVLIFGSHT